MTNTQKLPDTQRAKLRALGWDPDSDQTPRHGIPGDVTVMRLDSRFGDGHRIMAMGGGGEDLKSTVGMDVVR